jgi:predicted DNA-binding WGR domain protein
MTEPGAATRCCNAGACAIQWLMAFLTRIDPTRNIDRFYLVDITPTLFGEWALVREWGRRGSPGTVRLSSYAMRNEPETAEHRIIKRHLAHGYNGGARQAGEQCRRYTSMTPLSTLWGISATPRCRRQRRSSGELNTAMISGCRLSFPIFGNPGDTRPSRRTPDNSTTRPLIAHFMTRRGNFAGLAFFGPDQAPQWET